MAHSDEFYRAMVNREQKSGFTQWVLHCACGREKVLALGLCAICYSLKRQDRLYFGGLRETVLARDGYRCRVCDAPGRIKRSIIVHHRAPGRSVLGLMISLCPGCHAKVHRTIAVMSKMPLLLLELWREQHPNGHEQKVLLFETDLPVGEKTCLFPEFASIGTEPEYRSRLECTSLP